MRVGELEFSTQRRILLQRTDLLLLACLHLGAFFFLSWWLLSSAFTAIPSRPAGGLW